MLLMGMLYEVPSYRYPVSNRESGLGLSAARGGSSMANVLLCGMMH